MLMGDDIMENLATIAFIFFPLAAFMLLTALHQVAASCTAWAIWFIDSSHGHFLVN